MFGLVEQFGDRPLPGHDDHRRDVAQLGRHRLVQHGLVTLLTTCALGAGTEDDGVIGLVRARDVDLVDQRVTRQVGADRGATVDDLEDPDVDECREGAAPVGHEVVIDGVGLHDDDLALDEEFRQRVPRAQRRDIAGRQDQGRAGVGVGVGVGGGLTGDEVVPGDAGLHEDLGGRLRERDAVEGTGREDLDPQPTVRRLADRPRKGGLPVSGDVAQRVTQQARHANECPNAGGQLFARLGRTGRQTLGAAGVSQPLVLHGQGVGDDLLEQIGACGGIGAGPGSGSPGDLFDDRIERRCVGRHARRGPGA